MTVKLVTAAVLGLCVMLAPAPSVGRQATSLPESAPDTPAEPQYVLLQPSALPSPDGEHPVFRPADAGSKAARLVAVLLEDSYARQALLLHQYVRNYLAHQPGADPAAASEPTYFALGGQGGYAAHGFWLEGDQGQLVDKRTASYVSGLSAGAGYWGDLEQLFPHELGHAMLAELCGWQQAVLASQVHQVTMLTDYQYAFNEGWAEHFQVMAVEQTANPQVLALRENRPLVGEQGPYARLARELRGRGVVGLAKASLPLWQAQREQHLRYAGVQANLFARQVAVPEALLRGRDVRATMTYQALIPPDETSAFRNGPQMLASEGLVATLLARLVSDPQLQRTYREPAFYEPFLPPGYRADWSQTSPQRLFSPQHNVYLKLYRVLARHVRLDGDLAGESPTVLVLKGYAADYPDEAKWVYRAFLDVTQGVTVEPRALRAAQDRVAGRLGGAEHRAYLRDLQRRLAAGEVEIDSGLAPQIWLRNPWVEVSAWALDAYASIVPGPYNLNLNAATVADLCTVPGLDAGPAREIVRVRDAHGGFGALDGLAGVPGMTPDVLDRLHSMEQAMRAWIEEGAGHPEDELQLEAAAGVVAGRLLSRVAVVLAVAGLVFALGAWLRRAGARRLGLEAPWPNQCYAGGRARHLIPCVGRTLAAISSVLAAVILPAAAFFALQLLLLLRSGGPHGAALVPGFALAVWLFVALPRLGRHLLRRQPNRRAALHRAAWDLGIYLLLFGALGWLVGA